MYSYEDRIRAVKLYIKLGKRTGATLRQLGYPTKNALKSWHRAYERGGDKASGSHRVVHPAGQCESSGAKAWREQANVVQMERSTTRSRGSISDEMPQ